MASTEVTAPREDAELHDHPTPRKYVWIAVILAVVTAAEVAIYYIPSLESLLVPLLVVFATVKFIMVALYFMHLKFDSKLFRRLFVTGIVLAFAVFTIVLLTFFLRPEASGITG
ncbi:MAG TPA: cytochrome C oxidase subunit IV family protein [Actinomycetota bacterium]|nr:cytochrome C oxidase subunit IV family protein [Actinomycetota bacterium]